MLTKERFQQLQELIGLSSKEELIWINGYLSGLVGNHPATPSMPATTVAATAVGKISLVYGTETGNSKRLATQLAAVAKKAGVHMKLVGLDQYRVSELSKEEFFFIVISTQGEGEPPAPARAFYDHLYKDGLAFHNMKFAVLALGDSSYPQFCKTGEDVEAQLKKAGASALLPLRKCDVDYEADAAAWFSNLLELVSRRGNIAPAPVAAVAKKAGGKKYYNGTVLANINLNDRGSQKSTYHIELGTDEPIDYEPGDTIGIIPQNRVEVVERILQLAKMDPNRQLVTAKASGTVYELLLKHLNICYLLSSSVKKYAAIAGHEIPDIRMDLVDLLRIYPLRTPDQFEEVIKILLPIAPRLYSIASSPAAHGTTEVHITVARNRFLAQDEQRYGLCSDFLGDYQVGASLQFYVHKNRHFRLPAPAKDVVMIGPGTGVAPFRSFLAERDATGATGRNWFFFGEQHFVTDFLYQAEIQNYVQTGVLTRIDLAFSRDQAEKIYVQHRMEQHAAELFQWIDNGASVFISGTKDPMGKDVEQALLSIIASQGNKTTEEAKTYLDTLKKEGRYEKDVY